MQVTLRGTDFFYISFSCTTISTLMSLLMACSKCIQWLLSYLLSSITTDWVWLLIFMRFLDHTQRRITVGKTPLNEWSVRRRDLYLITHNNHNRHIHAPRRAEDFYLPLKIRRLRPGLNPRTCVPKASTLPLDHRSRLELNKVLLLLSLVFDVHWCNGAQSFRAEE